MEVLGRAGPDQPFPEVLMPDQSCDPAEDFDVLSGRRLGTHDKEKQPDWLPVEGIKWNRRRRNASDHAEFPHRGRLAVRNGDAESDPRAELLLPPHYRPICIVEIPARLVDQAVNQFADRTGLVGRGHRHHHALGSNQLTQEHGRAGRRIGQT